MDAPAERIVVISDLHLGGEAPQMCSKPQLLADFIRRLPDHRRPGERLELVIAGDFVDFLAIPPFAPSTPDATSAVRKLEKALAPPFDTVFGALRDHVAAGHRLSVMSGNHDVELFLPEVEARLRRELGGDPALVQFLADGAPWRRGGLLVEHGNRYDDANLVDLDWLRRARSARARGEPYEKRPWVCEGSELVAGVISPLKKRYPFIDLLQPGGEVAVLLLAALEPTGLQDLPGLYRGWRASREEARNRYGDQPLPDRAVAAEVDGEEAAESDIGPELEALFPGEVETLRASGRAVGSSVLGALVSGAFEDGLAHLIRERLPVEPARLARLQAALRPRLLGDRSLELDGPVGRYGVAAARMRERLGVEVVVMGHTHQARDRLLPGGVRYLNTGTWADVIEMPAATLVDSPDGRRALLAFLRSLVLDDAGLREQRATWAEVVLRPEQSVASAALGRLPR